MRLIALATVRNEAWVLPYSARVVLSWCDHLVILDHASTDRTRDVICELIVEHPRRITLLHESDPTMQWMRTRQRLLEEGRRQGGTAFASFDADEILSSNLVGSIRAQVEDLRPGEALWLPWHNLWRDLSVYRDDLSKHGKQHVFTAFADHPGLHWLVPEELHHRQPEGLGNRVGWPPERATGGLMHLQRVVWRRAQARQDLYRMQEVTRWPGREPVGVVDRRYAASLDERGARLLPVPPEWWAHGLDRSLIDLDAEPWEVGERARMLAEHGRSRFKGLSLSC